MEGEENCQWVDMIIDEIGYALTKVDETIQKSIELWTELTKDMFDDQRTQELTGQPNNVISGEEHSSEDKSVAEVKERPIQHWAMRLDEVNEELIQHSWALCASKVQEQGNDHYDDRDGDGDDDDYDDDDDNYDEEEDETTVYSESSENMWEFNLGASAMTSSEEDRGSSLRWKGGYELLKDVSTSSEEDDESWDDDYDYDDKEEEDETSVSEYCENIWELNFGTLAKPPSLHRYHNEEDSGSSLRWKDGYELLKNAETFSEEDDDELEEVWKYTKVDAITESLLGHDGEDDVSDKLQGFVDVSEEDIANDSEVETLSPECDWVYVKTRSLIFGIFL